MITQIVSINFFLCPLLSVLIHYKRSKKELRWSVELVLLYGVFTVVNSIFSKVISVLVDLVLQNKIAVDSSYYTVFSLLSSFLLPYLWEVFSKNWRLKCEIGKEDAGNGDEEERSEE